MFRGIDFKSFAISLNGFFEQCYICSMFTQGDERMTYRQS